MEEAFYCRDGKVAKDLHDLSSILREMNDDEFSHHVTDSKNDFANWVEHVLGDAEIAGKLRSCLTKQDLFLAIDEALMRSQVSASLNELKSTEPISEPIRQEKKQIDLDPLVPPEPPGPAPRISHVTPGLKFAEEKVEKSDSGIDKTALASTDNQPSSNERLKQLEKSAGKQFHSLEEPKDDAKDDSIVIAATQAPGSESDVKSDSNKSADSTLETVKSDVKPDASKSDKKNNPKYFSLKEFLLGLLFAFLLGIAVCMVATKLLQF